MQRDSLALFMSLIALILSVFYFLSFYSFKDSRMMNYDNENIYLDKYRTYLCDDIRDRNTCKHVSEQCLSHKRCKTRVGP